jgi:Protein of unknown function (DUF3307)
MATAGTAAVTAVAFIALYAGHQIGDHAIQTNTSAMCKGAPTSDLLAAGVHPWTGWSACLRHVGTYAFVQAAALALAFVVAPLGWHGIVAALAVSASTHAVIDRRWIVRLVIEAKGCHAWREAPYHIDQSLHVGALLVAAVLAAAVTNGRASSAVIAAAAALVGAALVAEKRLAAVAMLRTADQLS